MSNWERFCHKGKRSLVQLLSWGLKGSDNFDLQGGARYALSTKPAGTSWTNRNVPRPRHPSLGSFSYWEKHRRNEGPVPFLSRSITGGKFFTLSGMNKKAQLRTSAPVAWRFSTEAPAALAKTAFSTRTVDTHKGFGIPRNTWSLQPPNCPTGFTFHIFLLVLEPPEF